VGEFGQGFLNTGSLVTVLRAITNIPGYVPLGCSDRFDAMDSYPPDETGIRGGDGILNTLDLFTTLRRVVNIDTTRPTRTSRGACPPSTVPSSQEAARKGPLQGTVELEASGQAADGWRRTAVYLRADVSLDLAGLSLALGSSSGQLRFVPGDQAPSLVDTGTSGKLAVAWLNGWAARKGQRARLGYVESPGDAGTLSFYGVSANTSDGGTVNLGLGSAGRVGQ
jgi:hypothetical protein